MLNYFDQPHYSYGKKKSILAGFCAFIALFWKKKKSISVVWFALYISNESGMGFGAWEAGQEGTPKLQAQVLYIGITDWVHLVCFLNMFSFYDKCCNPILPSPLWWQQYRHLLRDLWWPAVSRWIEAVCSPLWEIGRTVPKEAGFSSCFHLFSFL